MACYGDKLKFPLLCKEGELQSVSYFDGARTGDAVAHLHQKQAGGQTAEMGLHMGDDHAAEQTAIGGEHLQTRTDDIVADGQNGCLTVEADLRTLHERERYARREIG